MESEIWLPRRQGYDHILSELGLKAEWLNEIGRRILAGYNQATLSDALYAAGTYAYLAGVRAMREILYPGGWEILRRHNLELIRHSKNELALVISSGDCKTGIDDDIAPKTKNTKGNQTHTFVSDNSLSLFPDMDKKEESCSEHTWILLYHIDKSKSEMRMELSFPINMNFEERKIDGWAKRVILSPIKFNPVPIAPVPDFAPEPKIEIRRRINE